MLGEARKNANNIAEILENDVKAPTLKVKSRLKSSAGSMISSLFDRVHIFVKLLPFALFRELIVLYFGVKHERRAAKFREEPTSPDLLGTCI